MVDIITGFQRAQVHVGSRGFPNNLYAFEMQKWLPKFAMYAQVRTKVLSTRSPSADQFRCVRRLPLNHMPLLAMRFSSFCCFRGIAAVRFLLLMLFLLLFVVEAAVGMSSLA